MTPIEVIWREPETDESYAWWLGGLWLDTLADGTAVIQFHDRVILVPASMLRLGYSTAAASAVRTAEAMNVEEKLVGRGGHRKEKRPKRPK